MSDCISETSGQVSRDLVDGGKFKREQPVLFLGLIFSLVGGALAHGGLALSVSSVNLFWSWGVVLGFMVVLPYLLLSNSHDMKGIWLLFLVWVVGLDFYFSEKYDNCSVCKLAIPSFLIIAFDVLIAFLYIAWISKIQAISILEFLLAALMFIVGWNGLKMQQWFLIF